MNKNVPQLDKGRELDPVLELTPTAIDLLSFNEQPYGFLLSVLELTLFL